MLNVNNHFEESSKIILSLKEYNKQIFMVAQKINETRIKKNKILVAGNGGSCADADHFCGELTCTFKRSDRLPLSAINLANSNAAITAWGNDFGFESYFARMVKAHCNSEDIMLLISTGGGDKEKKTSINLIKATEEAKKRGAFIISLTGKSGGELKKISDLNFHIKHDTTAVIQEAHISILHAICIELENLAI